MRRFITFALCIVLMSFTFAGCSFVKDMLPPVPEDFYPGFEGEYSDPEIKIPTVDITDTKHTFNFKTNTSNETFDFSISGDKLRVSGSLYTDEYKYLIITFDRNSELKDENKMKVTNRNFDGEFNIPSDKSTMILEVYGGEAEYGTFESILIDYIVIEKTANGNAFLKSPVYDGNLMMFDEPKDISKASQPSQRVQSDNQTIITLAEEITKDCADDYQKIKAIHDWVAMNIYYDYDALSKGVIENTDAVSVYNSKKSVCEGYANLFAALSRSIGIACVVRGGYALGVDTDKAWNESNVNTTEGNHAWNEVYVNGRWIMVDTTWDSKNEYRSGAFTPGEKISSVYFDSDMEFFSMSHKLFGDVQ